MTGLLTDPLDDLGGHHPVLGDVGTAAAGRWSRSSPTGIECVTKTMCPPRRASSGSSASADSVASTIGSTKPGWLK